MILLSKADLLAFFSEAENLEAYRRRSTGRGVWLVLLGLTALPEALAEAAFKRSVYWTLDYSKPEEHVAVLVPDPHTWSPLYVKRYSACVEAVRHFAGVDLVVGEEEQLLREIDTLSKLHRRVRRHRCSEHS